MIPTQLYTQAANSPHVNLLDLGFFRAIQSFNDATPKNKEESVESVSVEYENYPRHKINQTWLTLQCCFNQIIIHNGDNDYNIDHIAGEKWEQLRQLLDVMDVVEDADCIFTVNDSEGETDDNSDDENTITPT